MRQKPGNRERKRYLGASVRGCPSQVKGVGLRTRWRRPAWVRIPPPAPHHHYIQPLYNSGITAMRKPRLYIYYLRHDDPKKNTALKVIRHRYATLTRRIRTSIILTPFSETPVAPTDTSIVEQYGITVIDGSWKKTLELLRRTSRKKYARRLPLLLAGNPINYSKLLKLSSLEALAATLYITGYTDYAERLLSLYKWGKTFLVLNQELLQAYSSAKTAEEIIEIECTILEKILPHMEKCDRKTINTLTETILTDDH